MAYDQNEYRSPQEELRPQPVPGPAAPAPPAADGTGGQALPESTRAVPVFAMGLVGLLINFPVSCVCPYVAIIGGILGAIALFMGLAEKRRVAQGQVRPHQLLTAGWISGLIAVILCLLWIATVAVFIILAATGKIESNPWQGRGF